MKTNHLTLKIFLLIVLNDIGDTIAQLIMKKGLINTGISSVNFTNIFEFAVRNASSALLWLGITIYIVNFFIWIVVLYRVDLSIAMPVGSTAFILVPISALVFLHEDIDLVRWIGIACIALGIHFVAQSKKEVKEAI